MVLSAVRQRDPPPLLAPLLHHFEPVILHMFSPGSSRAPQFEGLGRGEGHYWGTLDGREGEHFLCYIHSTIVIGVGFTDVFIDSCVMFEWTFLEDFSRVKMQAC